MRRLADVRVSGPQRREPELRARRAREAALPANAVRSGKSEQARHDASTPRASATRTAVLGGITPTDGPALQGRCRESQGYYRVRLDQLPIHMSVAVLETRPFALNPTIHP